MAPRHPSESAVHDTRLILPSASSSLDNRVWGGELMKDLDMAAFAVASRHSRNRIGDGGPGMAPPVTAAIDDVIFERIVRVGQCMTVSAHLTRVWGSSMEVEVIVEGEDLNHADWGRWPVMRSHLTFVGLHQDTGKPAPVPPLTAPETDGELTGFHEAEERKQARLARRSALLEMPAESAFRLSFPCGSSCPLPSSPSLAKTPRESFVQMTETIFQRHTNARGTAFGGQILAWGGMATAVSAARHCMRRAELAAVHDIQFLRPIELGDIVILRSQVLAAFDHSVVVGLDVLAEDPDHGQQQQALTAMFVFVTPMSDAGRRPRVPALEPTTEAEAEWAVQAAAYGARYKEEKEKRRRRSQQRC